MAIEIRDTDNGIGNIITGHGSINSHEWLELLKNHLSQDKEKLRKYRYSLSDYTATCELDFSTPTIRIAAELCKKSAMINPNAIVAIAAGNDFSFGMSRMWETLASDTNWECMVFRSLDDAKTWISNRVNEKYGIDTLTFN